MDDNFLKQLRETFAIEADEHLQKISELLIELESSNNRSSCQETLDTLYREFHSLKGAARAVNMEMVESLCQHIESYLSHYQDGVAPLPEQFFTLVHQGGDILRKLIFETSQPVQSEELQNYQHLLSQALSSPDEKIIDDIELKEDVTLTQPSDQKLQETSSAEQNDSDEKEFMEELRDLFYQDTLERLARIEEKLISLEQQPELPHQEKILDNLFKEFHSLKSAAGAVEFDDISAICQELETLFTELRDQKLLLTPFVLDQLHAAVHLIRQFSETSSLSGSQDFHKQAQETLQRIKLLRQPAEHNREATSPPLPSPTIKGSPRTQLSEKQPNKLSFLRIPSERIDKILFQAEEMITVKLSAESQLKKLKELQLLLEDWRREWLSIKSLIRDFHFLASGTSTELIVNPEQNNTDFPDSDHNTYSSWNGRDGGFSSSLPTPTSSFIDEKLIKKTRHLIHFLMVNEKFLQRVKSQLHYLERNSSQNVYSLETSIDKLMEEAKKLLLLPFDSISRGFPKMVRDLATSLGKKAEITIEGKEVEIDKRILEEMKDPLIHLIRNSVDHGLEYPEERIRLGKPAQGKITLRVSPRDSGKVEILVSDDGAGIEVEKVKKAALENGIISEKIAHSMTEEEALSLIFISRISTSEIITEISGRGMGMSIVKEKVENLGGEIKVSTKPNLGTTFRLILPLTLVRFRGILLEAANRLFIIPTTQVERVLRVKKDQVKTVKNIPTISLEGQVISLVSLAEVLGISSPQDNPDTPFLTLFLLNGNEQKIAFACDRIIAEQEVVVKGLGKQLLKVKNISGATVLGNGKVVPVLKPGDLLKSAHAMVKRGIITHQPKQEEQPKKRILVVDDSITSRSLISHILDAAGYEVETAIDGVEAMERLKGGSFQLVVSDVEMPRMNGYELTATIRQEAKLENLPVILVTSRGSKADMEAGIEAGADAYIVKSNFDQSNLLETIRRFI